MEEDSRESSPPLTPNESDVNFDGNYLKIDENGRVHYVEIMWSYGFFFILLGFCFSAIGVGHILYKFITQFLNYKFSKNIYRFIFAESIIGQFFIILSGVWFLLSVFTISRSSLTFYDDKGYIHLLWQPLLFFKFYIPFKIRNHKIPYTRIEEFFMTRKKTFANICQKKQEDDYVVKVREVGRGAFKISQMQSRETGFELCSNLKRYLELRLMDLRNSERNNRSNRGISRRSSVLSSRLPKRKNNKNKNTVIRNKISMELKEEKEKEEIFDGIYAEKDEQDDDDDDDDENDENMEKKTLFVHKNNKS